MCRTIAGSFCCVLYAHPEIEPKTSVLADRSALFQRVRKKEEKVTSRRLAHICSKHLALNMANDNAMLAERFRPFAT